MTQATRPPLVCHGHTRPVPELNFSQNTPDGYFIVSACKDGKAMLRRGDTGDWIGTFDGHGTACVWSCALNTPAVLAATGSADFTCKLWNAISGLEQHTWQHPQIVRSVHFSTASDLLATGCRDKTARIFSVTVPSADPLISFTGLRDCVHSVKFINDDRELLVAYSDAPGLSVLDVRSGQEARHIDLPAKVRAIDLSYAGAAAQTVTIACGREVRVLEGTGLTKRASVTLENPVASASLSPDGNSVVAGGEDMWAYLMDFPSGKVRQISKGHHGPIWSLQFAPHGQTFASASEDGTIRIWDACPADASQPATAAAAQ
eukprot:jgi/Ulvmu1/5505/UM023_0041.1